MLTPFLGRGGTISWMEKQAAWWPVSELLALPAPVPSAPTNRRIVEDILRAAPLPVTRDDLATRSKMTTRELQVILRALYALGRIVESGKGIQWTGSGSSRLRDAARHGRKL